MWRVHLQLCFRLHGIWLEFLRILNKFPIMAPDQLLRLKTLCWCHHAILSLICVVIVGRGVFFWTFWDHTLDNVGLKHVFTVVECVAVFAFERSMAKWKTSLIIRLKKIEHNDRRIMYFMPLQNASLTNFEFVECRGEYNILNILSFAVKTLTFLRNGGARDPSCFPLS